jgi:hypothetical protein
LVFGSNTIWSELPNESSRNCSSKLRTMCGSRTGGWSLPCAMSA